MTLKSLLDAISNEGKAIKLLAPSVAINPRELIQRDIALSPPGLWSSNRHCQMVEASDGWLAVNMAREDDRDAVPAWLQCDAASDCWDAIVLTSRQRSVADLISRATLLGLPVAAVGETPSSSASAELNYGLAAKPLADMSVIDLSALWAGPLCGGLLAQAGMTVTKIESPTRPDPTAASTPLLDKRLNGRKRRITMNLTRPELLNAIANSDVLITSARAHALARLGLTPDALFARNPGLIWVAITAHGFGGSNAMRVGFGDDAAAAGGLVRWNDGEPRFLGDALADPLTGLRAAHRALTIAASGTAGLIDVALAQTAADFARRAGLL